MSNPFLRRNMIRSKQDFWGRKRELATLYSLLLDAEEESQSVALIGQRRIGKSSLLYRVAQLWGAADDYQDRLEKTICLFLTLQSHVRSTADEFYSELLEELVQVPGEVSNFIKALSTTTTPHRTLEKVIRIFSQQGYRFIILLDEFDAIVNNAHFDTDFFSQLRSLTQPYNVAFVLSIQRDLDRLWDNDAFTSPYYSSPFFNIFQALPLSLFTQNEAIEYLQRTSYRESFLFDDDDIRRAIYFGGHHPYFLTLSAYHIFSVKSGDSQMMTQEQLADTILHDTTAVSVCKYYWKHLDSVERSILKTISRPSEKIELQPEAMMIVKRLERQGLITRNIEGSVILFGEIFRHFIENLSFKQEEGTKTNEKPKEGRDKVSTVDSEITWRSICRLEILLRTLIEERYRKQFGDRWIERVRKIDERMFAGWEENKDKEDKKFARYNQQNSLIHYAYLGDLLKIITAEWQLFRDVFGLDKRAKQELQYRVEAIVPVRNPLAHSREVPENELKRADVFCDDILHMIHMMRANIADGSSQENTPATDNPLPE